jgi:hypothetical protein
MELALNVFHSLPEVRRTRLSMTLIAVVAQDKDEKATTALICTSVLWNAILQGLPKGKTWLFVENAKRVLARRLGHNASAPKLRSSSFAALMDSNT